MEPTDYHCMNRFCNWEVLNTRKLLHGIACPECNGHTVISRMPKKPRVSDRACYVRDKILELNKEHCHALTPEQVETVLSIGDSFAISVDKKESNIQGAAKDKVIALLTDYDVAYIDYDAKEDEYSIRLDKEKNESAVTMSDGAIFVDGVKVIGD